MTAHPITLFLQLVVCSAICGAVGYRIGLLPDSGGENCAAVVLWVLALIGIVMGLVLSIDGGKKAEHLIARLTFWCGTALVVGHFIGAWP